MSNHKQIVLWKITNVSRKHVNDDLSQERTLSYVAEISKEVW